MSVNRRRQALQLCLDSAVVVVIQIVDQLLLEVLHGLKILQIQQLTFEQSKEILNHSIVQTVALAAHALSDSKFDVRQNLSDGLNNLTENNQPKKAINNRIPKRKFLQGAFYNEFRVLNYKKLIIQNISISILYLNHK